MGVSLNQLIDTVGLMKEYVDGRLEEHKEFTSNRTRTDLLYESYEFIYTAGCDLTPFVATHHISEGSRPNEHSMSEYQMIDIELSIAHTVDVDGTPRVMVNTENEIVLGSLVVESMIDNPVSKIHLIDLSADVITYDKSNTDMKYYPIGKVEIVASLGDNLLDILSYKVTAYEGAGNLNHTAMIRVYGLNPFEELTPDPPIVERVQLVGTPDWETGIISGPFLKVTLDKATTELETTVQVDELGINPLSMTSTDVVHDSETVYNVPLGQPLTFNEFPDGDIVAMVDYGDSTSSYTMKDADLPVMPLIIKRVQLVDEAENAARPTNWTDLNATFQFNQPVKYGDLVTATVQIHYTDTTVKQLTASVDSGYPSGNTNAKLREVTVSLTVEDGGVPASGIDYITGTVSTLQTGTFKGNAPHTAYQLTDNDVPKYSGEA